MSELYRKAIAVIILNEVGEILICERHDRRGAWQIPQGGVDPGEDLAIALERELSEEIGLTEFTLLGQLEDPISYDFPEGFSFENFKGQEHTYFIVQTSTDYKFSFEYEPIEFCASKWVSKLEFEKQVLGFKKVAYLKALDQICISYPALIKES